MKSSTGWTYLSKQGLSTLVTAGGRAWHQLATTGAQPSSVSDTYMIPAREMVAGEALARFSGSNTAFMLGVMRMRSPLASVNTCAKGHGNWGPD